MQLKLLYLVKSPSQAPVLSGNQPNLETVTSVDELLQLLYPEYSLLQHCLRRKSWQASSTPSSSGPPPLHHSNVEDLWGRPREMALYKVDGALGGKNEYVLSCPSSLSVCHSNNLVS